MFPLSSDSKDAAAAKFSDEERALLDKVAKKVIEWKMSVPAIMTLESVKPLNFIGSQAMVFFEPMVKAIFNLKEYDTFREMLERRESIEALLLRIEHFDAIAARKEKIFKKLQKDYLKTQSRGYRIKSSILGFRVPKHLEAEWKAKIDAVDAEFAAQEKPDSPEGRT